MNIPDFTIQDVDALTRVLGAALQMAGDHYKRSDSEAYYVPSFDDQPQQATLQDAIDYGGYMTNETIYMAMIGGDLSPLEDELAKYGLSQYVLIGEGSSARVFMSSSNDQRYATRVSFSSHESACREDNDRAFCPHVFQHFMAVDYDVLQAQIMPLALRFSAKDLEDDVDVYARLLKKLYQDTCFEIEPTAENDFVVLPDGCLVCVDPGFLHYKERFYDLSEDGQTKEIERCLELVASRAEAWELPTQFLPMERVGQNAFTFKQAQYFSAPVMMGIEHQTLRV